MNFVTNLSESKFLREAVNALKKEGQEFTSKLPSGTTVKYIRGKDIDGHGFGQKYCLYKEVTKPDGFRTVTNEHVFGDEVFVNEVFHIEPNGWCPEYVMCYDKYYYMRQPGISNFYTIGEPNGLHNRPELLKGLLLKKIRPFNEASERRAQKSWENHCRRCYESDPEHYSQYKQYREKAKREYNQQGSGAYDSKNSSKSSNTSDSAGSSAKKITKEQFVDFMVDKFSHMKSKDMVDITTLKDSEVRNLAKLFNISETTMRNFDKTTKRKLSLKYHPDTGSGDDLSVKIFQIVNKLQTVD